MQQRSIENFKKSVADCKALTTKVQKDNQNKTKNLKKTNLVLEAFKKEYQNLYLEQENLRKKIRKSIKRNCLNIETITRFKQQTKVQLLSIERLKLAISG